MELIDNINNLLGDDLKHALLPGTRLKIAATCFSIYAFEALKAELERIEELDFIFTSPTFVANDITDRSRKERKEFHIPKLDRERSLYGSEFEIQLRNKLTQRAVAKECANWIRKKAKFRSNRTKAPMQSFACIDDHRGAVAYTSLNGFTAVDLGYQKGDAVSNLVQKIDEAPLAGIYLKLFDQIWFDTEKLQDVTAQICDHIASVYQENSPESIYMLMLYNIFQEFLEDIDEDVLPNDRTGYNDTLIWNKLFNFQRDAAIGLINKLETYSGCILADSVGLGKTFTALAVIKYYELRNRAVLVLSPKKLADNWLNYNQNLKTNMFAGDRFNYDVLCHTDLSRTKGESFGMPLNRVNWGNYDLVVIDESHNFRNNDAYREQETRYQKLMRMVIKEGVKTKVLMLSATPVNNRFNDLRNQLALAYEGNSANLNSKLRTGKSIEEIFRNAQASFNSWAKLPADERTASAILGTLDFDFFELLDSVTIARSRKHIQTFYDTQDIGPFPDRRRPLSFSCPLTERTDVLSFNAIFEELSALKQAVYAPISYVLPSRLEKYAAKYDTNLGGNSTLRQLDREKSLQALMTVNLLKRLESSVHAFRTTLQSLLTRNAVTIERITGFNTNGGTVTVSDYTESLEQTDTEDDDVPMADDGDNEIGGKIRINLEDMDLQSWERDLRADLQTIDKLLAGMTLVSPEDDSKLQHLVARVFEKIANPINPGNKKVLIFTAYADTANYLYENLAPVLLEKLGIHTAKVTGSEAPQSTLRHGRHKRNYDFQEILTLFSPRSKEKSLVLPDEPNEVEVLIGTDCISEGQNLQDCDYVVNYDIHWNPVRIIQRFGRVDRIGSPNSTIQLVNYWPDISLDEYINLKERVEIRMMIADVTATGDDNVLSAKANDVAYRKEQLRRLQQEVIELEDLKTGVSITDLGLNEFRMDLLNYVKEHGELGMLPNGMHAVVPARPDLGLVPGVIFTLRNRNSGVNVNQHNRLHPFYLVYIGRDGAVINDHTEVKRLLDLVRTGCKGEANPVLAVYERFNLETDDGRTMQAYSDLLGKSIRSMIEVNEEKDVDSLFTSGRTTALTNTLSGLDDFELISFLVIEEAS